MYCLIASDSMRVLGYHPQWEYTWEMCCAYAHEDGHVVPLEPRYFEDYSAVDLQAMYIGLTNDKSGLLLDRFELAEALIKIISTMPVHNLSTGKLQSLTNATLATSEDRPIEFSITITEDFKMDLLAGKCTPVWNTADAARFVLATQAVTQGNHTKSDSVARAPRVSGTRDLIWETATQMWKDAGASTDKSVILMLRRDIMTKLETLGVNRNSASNELGRWQKDLLQS